MDELPELPQTISFEELYGNGEVTVGDYSDISELVATACQIVFGRELTTHELIELIAAPGGSTLTVDTDPEGESIGLRLTYRYFDGTHEYDFYVDGNSGTKVVEFVNIKNVVTAPKYLQTLILAKQVESFQRFGLDEIRLFAEGYPNHPNGIIGYYVWPLLGFNMSVDGFAPRLVAEGFEDVEDTLDLFSRADGPEWWEANGSEREAVFYLDPELPCIEAMFSYLEERGLLDVDKEDVTPQGTDEQNRNSSNRPT